MISGSILEIFRIGPGPSSSHTIAPMRAANRFGRAHPGCREVEVHFYGSLALTGKGHGSDRAVTAGLLGEMPENCDTVKLAGITFDADHVFRRDGWLISFYFHREAHDFPYQNTLRFIAGDIVETYYSTGGGALLEAAAPEVILPYRYRSMDTFRKILKKHRISPVEVLLANEKILNPALDLTAELEHRIDLMCRAVERGLAAAGKLPGELGVSRRAKLLYRAAQRMMVTQVPGWHMLFIDACALAAAEENAAGALVLTAPTSGSSGLIPGIVYYLLNHQMVEKSKLAEGLMIAGLFGLIARSNASISGAEVGCQGEIGIASAMAAAMLAYIHNADFATVEAAAEIALEHHLGLSCDPVGGYVQIPCIERNAIGAVTAYNAFLLAYQGDSDAVMVSFDEVLSAMLETGRAMSGAYKETGLGGLARCCCCI